MAAESLRGILPRALDAHGLTRKLLRQLPVEVWRAAVGAEIASRASPTGLQGGVLHLLVQDHRWRDQLDAARELLIARVNEKLGRRVVRELRFGLAHGGFLEPKPARSSPRPARLAAAGAPECPESAQLLGAARLSPELRAAVLSAAGAHLRRPRA